MTEQPELATRPAVDAMVSAIEYAGTRGPGGPFPGWEDPAAVEVGADEGLPGVATAEDVATSAAEVFAGAGAVGDGRDRGVVQHVLTHAHAIVELMRLGHDEAARTAIDAHRIYRELMTRRPEHVADALPADADPPDFRSAAYWRRDLRGSEDWLYGHVFKVAVAWTALQPMLPPDLEIRASRMLATTMVIT